jgi:hypothetical protein
LKENFALKEKESFPHSFAEKVFNSSASIENEIISLFIRRDGTMLGDVMNSEEKQIIR